MPIVVNVVPPPVTHAAVNADHESKVWFEMCQRNGRMDNNDMLEKDISRYVRTEWFLKLKFIMHKTQLVFSSDPVTLCALICKDFGMVDPTTAAAWWERYKGMMADVLNAK
jgi:hypothetical protein